MRERKGDTHAVGANAAKRPRQLQQLFADAQPLGADGRKAQAFLPVANARAEALDHAHAHTADRQHAGECGRMDDADRATAEADAVGFEGRQAAQPFSALSLLV